MKLKQIVVGAVMVLCAGLGIFALTKLHKSGSGGDPDDEPLPENITPVISVQTGALQRMTLHRYVTGFGTVEPMPATADEPASGGVLAAPVAGIVTRVAAVAGQHVHEGDVLVELNSGTVSFKFAKAEVERQKKLFAEQNTSLKNLQDAESQLASLEIRAPVSGTVTRISARTGTAVDANAVIAEVIDLDRLAVSAQIPASEATALKTSAEFQVLTEPTVTTSLSFISPAVDTNDGTVLARAALPPNNGLRPGQFVPLRIVTAVQTNCLAAPAESVVTGTDGKSFIVLVKGDEASQTPVTTGLRENDWIEIEGANLKEGDSIVTVGAYGFPDKAKIRAENSPTNEVASTNSAAAQ
jgi:multidrug efflux pump subunit AcrA (membrane-fusion protein)